MRVLILTQGSRGDVQPFAALAKALHEAGHEVVFGAPKRLTDLAKPYSNRVVQFDDGWTQWVTDPKFRREILNSSHHSWAEPRVVRTIRGTRRYMSRVLDDMASAGSSDVDIVVHNVGYPGHQVAEKLGVPAVPVCLQPMWVPTSSFSDPHFPLKTPQFMNRFTFIASKVLWRTWVLGSTATWRKETLELPRRRRFSDPLWQPDGKPATVLQAFSRHILPSSLSYPEWTHTIGFFRLAKPESWQPPEVLTEFLSGGDPPVYIGFGSMIGSDPARTARTVIDAVRLAGVRAIIAAGWGGLVSEGTDEDVLVLNHAPHDWLFPQMGAVVHHGGSGTIGAALASGRPQVVCPFSSEQQFFGDRLYATGVASIPVPQRELTSERLASAIQRVVRDQQIVACADELGQKVRAEDGTSHAVEILESILSN